MFYVGNLQMKNAIIQDISRLKLQFDLNRNKINNNVINKFSLFDRLDVFQKLKNKQQSTRLFRQMLNNEILANPDIPEGAILLSLSFKTTNQNISESLFKEFMTDSLTELYFLKGAMHTFSNYSDKQDGINFINQHFSGFAINYMPFTDLGNNRRDDNVYILMYNNFKNKPDDYTDEQFNIIKEEGFKNVLLCLSHINIFYYLEQYKNMPDSSIDTLVKTKEITQALFPNNKEEIEHYFKNSFIEDFFYQSLSHSIFNFKERTDFNTNEIFCVDPDNLKKHMIVIGTTGHGMSGLKKYVIWNTLFLFNDLKKQDEIKKIFNIDNKISLFHLIWNISFLNYKDHNKISDSGSLLAEFIYKAPESVTIFDNSNRDIILESIQKKDTNLRDAIIERNSYVERELLKQSLASDIDNNPHKKKKRI